MPAMLIPARPAAASTRHSAREMLAALYAEYGSDLRRFAERLTGDPGSAEDIVQETMLRAWRHPDRLSTRGDPPPAAGRHACLKDHHDLCGPLRSEGTAAVRGAATSGW